MKGQLKILVFVAGDQVLPVAFMVNATPVALRSDFHDNFLSAFYERFSELLSGRFVIITGHDISFRQESFPVSPHQPIVILLALIMRVLLH